MSNHTAKKFFILFNLLIGLQVSWGQNNFQIDPDPFSPPEKAWIESFENQRVMPVQARAVNGMEINVPSKNGKSQLLWFTSLEKVNTAWLNVIQKLNDLSQFEVILFTDDLKKEVLDWPGGDLSKLKIVPNSRMLSEAVFGSELGNNRAFAVNPFGIIEKVFLAKELVAQGDMVQYIISHQ